MRSKKIYFFVLFALIGYSCSKVADSEKIDADDAFKDGFDSLSYFVDSSGVIHNRIIDEFKDSVDFFGSYNLEGRVHFVENYFIRNYGRLNGFYDAINYNQSIISEFERIDSLITTTYDGIEYVREMYSDNKIDSINYQYFEEIFLALANATSVQNLKDRIDSLRTDVYNDSRLLMEEKTSLSLIFNIAVSSYEYWNQVKLPWYARDVAGAMAGVQSGVVGYIGLWCPWCGAAALIGCGAVASMLE
ncbi:MAG: hypothetical protein PHQ65_13305 [Bacteroidales bacterium]|nr:hypothetical protein [Bacteroidales bacterium]MDD3666236.1 hypothetical protein [Bacteroidales bacterium]